MCSRMLREWRWPVRVSQNRNAARFSLLCPHHHIDDRLTSLTADHRHRLHRHPVLAPRTSPQQFSCLLPNVSSGNSLRTGHGVVIVTFRFVSHSAARLRLRRRILRLARIRIRFTQLGGVSGNFNRTAHLWPKGLPLCLSSLPRTDHYLRVIPVPVAAWTGIQCHFNGRSVRCALTCTQSRWINQISSAHPHRSCVCQSGTLLYA